MCPKTHQTGISLRGSPFIATLASYFHHHVDVGAERQSVLPQIGFSTSKRQEFFQFDGAGIRDVVYGVGT
jgi:hypothetical protein